MKYSLFLIIGIFLVSCAQIYAEKKNKQQTPSWTERTVSNTNLDSLTGGQTYLSVYSEVHLNSEKEKVLLNATVSIRNPNRRDTIFLTSVEYFKTNGDLLRNYIAAPVYVAPMETLEIVIHRMDNEGGSGANFLFDWKKEDDVYPPIYECLMLSSIGTRNYSFSTQGHSIGEQAPVIENKPPLPFSGQELTTLK